MAQIEISINGRNYAVACDDGQEQHLSELGVMVNEKVAALVESTGQIGETRLLLMASLLIADDLAESVRQLEDVKTAASDAEKALPETALNTPGCDEETISQGLEAAAIRLESIAETLEQS